MTRRLSAIPAALTAALMLASVASAGVSGAHFVGSPSISEQGDTATVSGKIAGLGNVSQIDVEVTAEASCINRGGHNPSAENKDSATATGTFPVQNGKAVFLLLLAADFQPDCTKSMTIDWSLISVEVTAAGGVSLSYP